MVKCIEVKNTTTDFGREVKFKMETYLLRRIDTAMCGKGCRMWLGDLNGDGRMEIVMVQPDGGFDDR